MVFGNDQRSDFTQFFSPNRGQRLSIFLTVGMTPHMGITHTRTHARTQTHTHDSTTHTHTDAQARLHQVQLTRHPHDQTESKSGDGFTNDLSTILRQHPCDQFTTHRSTVSVNSPAGSSVRTLKSFGACQMSLAILGTAIIADVSSFLSRAATFSLARSVQRHATQLVY